MEEIWKDIEGYEGFYKISSFGNVLSLNYANHGYPKKLVPKVNNHGRLWVELVKCGKKKPFLIHRLVGMAFIPNPDNLPQINHKDENPKNNCVENLEWCDQRYNNLYSMLRHPERKPHLIRKAPYPTGELWHQIHKNHTGGRKSCGHKPYESSGPYKNTMPVTQYTRQMEQIKTWSNIYDVCKENDWRTSSIKECCEGKRKTAYGFRWQYAI